MLKKTTYFCGYSDTFQKNRIYLKIICCGEFHATLLNKVLNSFFKKKNLSDPKLLNGSVCLVWMKSVTKVL